MPHSPQARSLAVLHRDMPPAKLRSTAKVRPACRAQILERSTQRLEATAALPASQAAGSLAAAVLLQELQPLQVPCPLLQVRLQRPCWLLQPCARQLGAGQEASLYSWSLVCGWGGMLD